jgi:TorA maturation chaperone TorD
MDVMGTAAHRAVTTAGHGDTAVHTLLARAAMAQCLAACFRYPEPGGAGRLHSDLAELAARGEGCQDVASSAARLAAAAACLDDVARQVEYSRLFIGVDALALHESAYGPRRLTTAAELADVLGFYRAFGFDLSARSPETADHIGAELEFLAALLVKLAWAIHAELEEPREVTVRAAASFLETHLGRWMPALAQRIADKAPDTLTARAAAAADRLVRRVCEDLDVRPAALDPGVSGGEAEPFSCPHAATCR